MHHGKGYSRNMYSWRAAVAKSRLHTTVNEAALNVAYHSLFCLTSQTMFCLAPFCNRRPIVQKYRNCCCDLLGRRLVSDLLYLCTRIHVPGPLFLSPFLISSRVSGSTSLYPEVQYMVKQSTERQSTVKHG